MRLASLPRRFASVAAVVACAASVGAVGAAPARADDPQVISATSGSCTSSENNLFAFPAFASEMPDALARVTMTSRTGAAGYWTHVRVGDAFANAAGDVVWGTTGRVTAGQIVRGLVSCDYRSSASGVMEILSIPTAPTSFSGVSTPRAESDSRFAFNVPADGQYRLVVNVSQGAVRVGLDRPTGDTFDAVSRVERDINVQRGNGSWDHVLTVSALDGPPAHYTVGVVALPVAVTGPTVTPSAGKPGAVMTVNYALSGQATIDARVLAADGSVVRPLAEGLVAASGERSLRWDGLSAAGVDVASGEYTVALDVTDATGTRRFTAPVRVDATPPQVLLPTSRRLSRKRAIVVTVADPVAGLRRATMTVNGRRAGRLEPGGKIIYRPKGGWPRRARLNVKVTAVDRLGNKRTVRRVYRTR